MKKIKNILVVGGTFVLAMIALGSGYLVVNQRTTAPQKSAASSNEDNVFVECKEVVITFETPTDTPSPSPSPSSSPSGSPSPSSTVTPTPTNTPEACNSPCTTDSQCKALNADYICHSATNTCRHINWPDESDCQALPTSTSSSTPTPSSKTTSTPVGSTSTPKNSSIAQSTPTATPAILPNAGFSLPTIVGVSSAAILLVGAFLLAL